MNNHFGKLRVLLRWQRLRVDSHSHHTHTQQQKKPKTVTAKHISTSIINIVLLSRTNSDVTEKWQHIYVDELWVKNRVISMNLTHRNEYISDLRVAGHTVIYLFVCTVSFERAAISNDTYTIIHYNLYCVCTFVEFIHGRSKHYVLYFVGGIGLSADIKRKISKSTACWWKVQMPPVTVLWLVAIV